MLLLFMFCWGIVYIILAHSIGFEWTIAALFIATGGVTIIRRIGRDHHRSKPRLIARGSTHRPSRHA